MHACNAFIDLVVLVVAVDLWSVERWSGWWWWWGVVSSEKLVILKMLQ